MPGGPNLLQGHLNFLLAALAPAVILLLTMTSEPPRLTEWVAVCGLVVVAAAWMLVLPLALVATWAAWQRVRGIGGMGTQTAVLAVAALAAGDLGLPRDDLPRKSRRGARDQRRAGGVRVPVVDLGRPRRCCGAHSRVDPLPAIAGTDPRLLLAFTTTALALTAAVGAFQLWSDGEVTYYFWKVSLAMVVAVLLVVLAAGMNRGREPSQDVGGGLAWAGACYRTYRRRCARAGPVPPGRPSSLRYVGVRHLLPSGPSVSETPTRRSSCCAPPEV